MNTREIARGGLLAGFAVVLLYIGGLIPQAAPALCISAGVVSAVPLIRSFALRTSLPAKVLQVRVLLDLKCSLLVGIAILRLDDAGAKSQAQRLGHIALAVGKQSSVPLLDLRPGDRLGFLYPTVAFFQIHADWLFKICQADLSIAVTIHRCPPSARVFPDFCGFSCTYYTTNRPLCLVAQGFLYYLLYITLDIQKFQLVYLHKKQTYILVPSSVVVL